MNKKILLLSSLFILLIGLVSSCNDDNDRTLSIEEQNKADDIAITNFLTNYYFDDQGKVMPFSESVTPNDKDPLIKNAIQDPSGFWYVINPAANSGSGSSPDGTNNILLQYDLSYFIATEGGNNYNSLNNVESTINGLGVAKSNPSFYKKPANATQEDSYFLISGIINGLKHFKPVNKNKNDIYDKLQGIIIAPSRLAFARNANYLNNANDATFILNFELYKVCNTDTDCDN